MSDRLDPVSRLLALAAFLLGLYLFLGRLAGTPLQRGNEGMYAFPPIAMLESGDYLVPVYFHEPFLDKPPLTFWILAATYRLLGVSVFTARLPAALACLATIWIVGVQTRRRAGNRAGILAALILMFSFALFFTAVVYAADALLMLAVTVAVFTLDAACRQAKGSRALWGVGSGAALALAFYCKGLVGVVLAVGGVALGLLLDRTKPVDPWRRGAWAVSTLLLLLFPWHWAMTRRLGATFWETFFWKNQVLRASTRLYIQPHRGLLYYLGILAWAAFPWILALPVVLRRPRRNNLALGWFAFGFLFLSVLVMKREVYLLPLYPPLAILLASGLGDRSERPGFWQRAPWWLAMAAAAAGLILWARAFRNLDGLAGRPATLWLGMGLAALALAAFACARASGSFRALVATALASGVLLLGLENFDERLARFDPFPAWGERIRAECAGGCDLFLIANASSMTFYSRSDWTRFTEIPADLAPLRKHPVGFLVIPTQDEGRLPPLPAGSRVLERRLVCAKPRIAAAADPNGAFEPLSLVRIAAPESPALTQSR